MGAFCEHPIWIAPAKRGGDGSLAHATRSAETKAVSHLA